MAFLPGFRFLPTDEEILGHYLPRWSVGEALEPSLVHLIREVELYSKEPDKIYADLGIPQDQPDELYFFTLVKKKFRTKKSGNDNNFMERVAGIGTWTSQNSSTIFDPNTKQVMGYKNTLNFMIKKKNLKPSWIMHEYTLPNTQHRDQFWAFCSVKRGANGSKDKNKRPLLESTPETDVLCIKKRSVMNMDADLCWQTLGPQTFMAPTVGRSAASNSYAPPIGTTSKSFQENSGAQTEPYHQPISHIRAQTIDHGTLCRSSMSHGSKEKGKRLLMEENTAEAGICINKTRGLATIATYQGASTSYESTIGTRLQPDNGSQAQSLKCMSQHHSLCHQPTTALSPIILSPSVRHEVPEEPLHQCGASGVPGQASMLELGGLFEGFNDLPDSGSLWDFNSSSDPILNADINAMSGLLDDYDFISPQQSQNPNFKDLLLA